MSQSVTYEASGKSGLITGTYLKDGFDKCVAQAQAHGYGYGVADAGVQQSH